MKSWITETLAMASAELSNIGKEDIALDIDRIREHTDVMRLAFFRFPAVSAVADHLYECEDISDLESCISDLINIFPAKHISIYFITQTSGLSYQRRFISTFPESWAQEYIDMSYYYIDPITMHAKTSRQHFYFDEVQPGSPIEAHILKQAKKHGVGPSGIGLSSLNEHGDRILIALSSIDDHGKFRESMEPFLSDFLTLAPLLCDTVSEITRMGTVAESQLRPEQLQLLHDFAAGHSLEELNGAPYLSENINSAISKILLAFEAKTLTQAVVIASRSGMLDMVEYSESDVHVIKLGGAHCEFSSLDGN